MIYAFVVRFLAVAYNPIEASFEKNAQSLRESSRSLGKNKWLTLLKIETPVIRTAILSAVILVFVDILKELPLTMILRPFDFPTLATNAFTYAKINESVMQSSSAALIIIFIGTIPVILLHRLMKK
jgi:iron(III) transport system permease protein